MKSDDKSNDTGVVPDLPPKVLVLGGGVAGLTAAHELAERGYLVTVVEHAQDPRPQHRLPVLTDGGRGIRRAQRRRRRRQPGRSGPQTHAHQEKLPALGGMARTQWGWLPPRPRGDKFRPLLEVPDEPDGWWVEIDERKTSDRTWLHDLGTSKSAPGLGRHLDAYAAWGLERALHRNRWYGVRRHFFLRAVGHEHEGHVTSKPLREVLRLITPGGSLRHEGHKQDTNTVFGILHDIRDQGLEASVAVGSRPEFFVEGSISKLEWHALEQELRSAEPDPPFLSHVAKDLLNQGQWDATKCGQIASTRGHAAEALLLEAKDSPPDQGDATVSELIELLRTAYGSNDCRDEVQGTLCELIGYSRACRAVERLIELHAAEDNPIKKRLPSGEVERREKRKGIWAEPISTGLTHAGGLRVRPMGQLVPGEHGYRFFPAFYRNLLDMLGRIRIYEQAPLTDDQEAATAVALDYRSGTQLASFPLPFPTRVPSGRTVRDNLVSVESTSFAFPGSGRALLSRRRPGSVKEALENLGILLDGLGWRASEVALFQLKILEYATTCTARRADLEKSSWADFLCQTGRADDDRRHRTFSDEFLEQLTRWPRALIGLDAQEGDARTFGSVLLHLVLDTLRDDGLVDGTLNGPTSEAWFDPWVEDLARGLNVAFVRDTVLSINWDENDSCIHVSTQRLTNTPNEWQPYSRSRTFRKGRTQDDEQNAPELEKLKVGPACEGLVFDYLVIALSPGALAGVLQQDHGPFADLRASVRHATRDLGETDATHGGRVPENNKVLREANPDGPLRNFSGIQLFFPNETRVDPGHVYYPKAKWGLSSISQIQFRTARPEYGGFGGSLSVVLGQMHEGDDDLWGHSTEEIGQAVWGEIKVTMPDRTSESLDPAWIWLDSELHRKTDGHSSDIDFNASPYYVNLKGEWSTRPGAPEWNAPDPTYPMLGGVAVHCGQLSPTHTRLGTMEASCESARHAVNAVLRAQSKVPPREEYRENSRTSDRPCRTWNPEEHEFRDLDWMKQLDERLHARDVPHAFQALRLYDLLPMWFPEDVPSVAEQDRRDTLISALVDLSTRHGDVTGTLQDLQGRAAEFGVDKDLVARLFAPLRDYFNR